MRKLLGFALVAVFVFGVAVSGFAQESNSNDDSNKKGEVKTRFGVGFNQTLFSERTSPDVGVGGVTSSSYYTIKNKKEVELMFVTKSTSVSSSGSTSGGNAYHVISWQEFDISDKNNFPSESDMTNLSVEDRRTVENNWVAYGRGMALRYAYLDEVWKAKPLRFFVGPEIGIFFRHESLRFKDGQDRDNYRRGLSFGLKYGLNLLITKNFLLYVEEGGRFNFVTDVEIANFKTGVVYIF